MTALPDALDAIIEKAPALRRAGVLSVQVEGVIFQLRPHDESGPAESKSEKDDDDPPDLLHDPALYGRTKSVPGKQRSDRP